MHTEQSTPRPSRRRWFRRRRTVVIASSLVVALTLGGGAAWAAERYLVPHVAIANVDEYEAEQAALADDGTSSSTDDASTDGTTTDGTTTDDTSTAGTATTTATTYTSDDASIGISTVTTGSGDATVTYYVADVTLGDATVLRSAFADDSFGQNITETTSATAADNDAIFAVNGDYYGFRDTGIVIRNGVVYRDEGAREGLAFYADGSVEVYDETATTADELVADGVWNTLSFGPALLEDGEIVDGIDDVEVDTNVGNHSIQGEQPRTAVGVIDENHLVFVVVDGRNEGHSAGVTMTGLAEIMQSLGATTAYNLDGGGSSTMYFDGEVVNDPNGTQDERGTSDILYIEGED